MIIRAVRVAIPSLRRAIRRQPPAILQVSTAILDLSPWIWGPQTGISQVLTAILPRSTPALERCAAIQNLRLPIFRLSTPILDLRAAI